jgi:hypothetical protein
VSTQGAATQYAPLKIQPDYANCLYGRVAKRGKGDTAGAQEDMAKALKVNADVATAFVQSGIDSKTLTGTLRPAASNGWNGIGALKRSPFRPQSRASSTRESLQL